MDEQAVIISVPVVAGLIVRLVVTMLSQPKILVSVSINVPAVVYVFDPIIMLSP